MDLHHQLVLCTCPDRATAEGLARRLVEARVAACVNILPEVHSVYRWQGAVESGSELLLLIKTRADRYTELEQLIRTHHPYELPEIVAVSLVGGLQPYLSWIDDCLNA